MCQACAFEARTGQPLTSGGVDRAFETQAPAILEKMASMWGMPVPDFVQIVNEAYAAWQRALPPGPPEESL